MATASADRTVRIWNYQAVVSAQTEADERAPKLLAALSKDNSPINIVRFSPSQYRTLEGKSALLVAWGSDDDTVNVAELTPGAAQRSFAATVSCPNVENWRLVRAYQGKNFTPHLGEEALVVGVVDLAWSPPIERGDKETIYLAAASMDGTLRVYDVAAPGMNPVQVLAGHENTFAKGCAFDPAGRLLASQGDDARVILWSTDTWQAVHVIREPFLEGGGLGSYVNTMYTRLTWAPDGQCLIVPNCQDANRMPYAQTVMRSKWNETSGMKFVGHKLSTTVVKCSPKLFRPSPALLDAIKVRKRAPGYTPLVAIGSADNTLSVWIGAAPRPIVVTQKLFKGSVTDIAWAPDGLSLVACSHDGSVACLQLDKHEVGIPLTDAERKAALEEIYGKQNRLHQLPTSAEQLAAEELASKKASRAAAPAPASAALEKRLGGAGPGHPGPAAGPNTQPAAPLPAAPAVGAGGAAKGLPAALVKVMDRATTHAVAPGAAAAAAAPESAAAAKGKEKDPAAADKRTEGEAGLASPQGKRARPQPPAAAVAALPAAQAPAAPPAAPPPPPPPPPPIKKLALPLTLRDALRVQIARRPAAATLAQPATGPGAPIVLEAKNDARTLALAVRGAGEASTSASGLPGRRPRACLVRCSVLSPAPQPNAGGSDIIWEDELPALATVIGGCASFAAVGTDDGSLFVYSPGGRRLLPRLVLGSPPAFLDCSVRPATGRAPGCHLLCATQEGALTHWALDSMRKVRACSLAPLLGDLEARGDAIAAVRLSSAGLPLVLTQARHCFVFHAALEAWTAVADDSFPASAFHNTLPGLAGAAAHELAQLAAAAVQRRQPALLMAAAGADAGRQQAESRAHVESLVAASAALDSAADLERYVEMYGRVLATGAEDPRSAARIRELAADLLGRAADVDGDGDGSARVGTVRSACARLGLDPFQMLEERVVPSLGANRGLQALLSEIREDIKVARRRPAGEADVMMGDDSDYGL